MDVNRIAAQNTAAAGTPGAEKASLGSQFSTAFSNMLGLVGLQQGAGTNQLFQGRDVSPTIDRADANADAAPRADTADHHNDRGQDDVRANADDRRPEDADAGRRDDTDTRETPHDDGGDEPHQNETADSGDDAPQDDAPEQDAAEGDAPESEGENTETAAQDGDETTEGGEQASGENDKPVDVAKGPTGKVGLEHAETVAAVQPGAVAEQAREIGADKSAQGKAKAAVNTAHKPATDTPVGTPNDRAASGLDKAAPQAKAQTQANAAQNTNTAANANTANTAQQQTLAQQQRADLSQRLSPDSQTTVKVTTEGRGNQFVSQSSTQLAQNVVLAEDEGGKAAKAVTPQTTKASTTANPAQAQTQGAAQPSTTTTTTSALNPQFVAQQAAQQAANAATGGQAGAAQAQAASEGAAKSAAPTPTANAAPTGAQIAQNSQPAQKAAAAPPPRQPVNPQKVMQQVNVSISKGVAQGQDRISIQLRPAELGRIDVQIDVNAAGRSTATVVADRPETLDILKNDARGLEKALQDAGLNTNAGDLNFQLRQQQHEMARQGGKGGNAKDSLEDEIQALTSPDSASRNIIENDRIDIRA